jgi:glutaredoxin 3
MGKAVFYHAGCPVCVSAEQDVLNLIPANQVEVIHLGTDKSKVKDAEITGVKSVPALVLSNGNVLHINFGASIEELK